MKKSYLWLLLIPIMMLAAGCHKKQVQKKPDNLISRNTMVKILADCYVIESIVSFNPADTLNRYQSTKAYYKELFNRYQITREMVLKDTTQLANPANIGVDVVYE